ncbi:MAG: RnfABCDGE type electron transport complex subunit B [Clostridia bacterium]|nr:RnfABCDGE type electron transport complex subunit B [Clostridia bacterium]MBP5270856.1 RnfABCDGE type electron transport complex subunit B [Clostridia bacterium]
MFWKYILIPALLFAGIGAVLGLVLAIAGKLFEVRSDPRIKKIREVLPGANCGGCGKSGCSALAEAIVAGEAPPTACTVGGKETAEAIGEIMGVKVEAPMRMRAQVMCSGTSDLAKKKYAYVGAQDCIAAVRMGGGDKLCPNGCIGLGTCVSVCRFYAIKVINGVSVIDYKKCEGCGACVRACPKHIIKLIPYDSAHWVGCMSVEKGALVRKMCDVGCISCRKCEKNCPSGAIKVTNFVASIDYTKCTGCGVCVENCPRKIIWSAKRQDGELVITRIPEENPAEPAKEPV